MAQLKGKLSFEEERAEDLLTSNVFGSFKYVKPGDGLLPFLKAARTPEQDSPFAELPAVSSCRYQFWPQLHYSVSCEPDAIIRINHRDDSLTIVMIESKYFSGKSSRPCQGEYLSDQLAREWDNLRYIMQKEKAERGCLLYVTADYVMPCKEIEESQGELENKCGKRGQIAWVSWRVLPRLLEQVNQGILDDLRLLLLKLGLDIFRGVNLSGDHFKTVEWSFIIREKTFLWPAAPCKIIKWSFRKAAGSFNFSANLYFADWRFKG